MNDKNSVLSYLFHHSTDVYNPCFIFQVTTPMTVDSNGSGLTCPMCGMECSDTADLTAHVDGHFSSEHTPGTRHICC